MEGFVFMYILQNILTVFFVLGVCGYLVHEAYFSKGQARSKGVAETKEFQNGTMRYI